MHEPFAHAGGGKVISPRGGGRDVAHRLMGHFIHIGRDLNGERAAAVDFGKQAGIEGHVIVDPMESGVGEYDVKFVAGRGGPGCDVGRDPLMEPVAGSRFVEHLRRAIEAGNGCVGPALRHHCRAVAGAAAEVNDGFGVGHMDLGNEVVARAGAFGFEQQILVGLPSGHVNFYYVGLVRGGGGGHEFVFLRLDDRAAFERFAWSGDVTVGRGW